MRLLFRTAMLVLAAGLIAGAMYWPISTKPPVHSQDLFPRDRARVVLHLQREQSASIRAVPAFLMQSGVIVAIAIGARKLLGVSLNRRPTK